MSVSAFSVVLLLTQAQASVIGTIRDSETGTPVVGATVEIVDAGRTFITDRAGSYVLAEVTAGARHLKISGLGYWSRTLHVFVPAEGAIQLDVALEPQPILLPPIAVSSSLPPRAESEAASDLDRRIGTRSVTRGDLRSHPGLAEPDFFEALAGNGVLLDPENPSGLHVHGGSSDQNLFLLDGIPIYSPYHATGQFSALNPDAISRVDLHAVAAPSAWDGALSGYVDARTATPNTERMGVRGAVTATGARLTVDGRTPFGGGVLVSTRRGYPGFLAPAGEASYVRGSFTDDLVKITAPTRAGRFEFLAFSSASDLQMASTLIGLPEAGALGVDEGGFEVDGLAGRNLFEWESRSIGIGWRKSLGERASIDAKIWRADLDVDSDWRAADAPLSLSSGRRTYGSRLTVATDGRTSSSRFGISAESEHTFYIVRPLGASSGQDGSLLQAGGTPEIFAAFAEHQRTLAGRFHVLLGLRGSFMASRHPMLAPRLSLTWPLTSFLSVSAGYARTHQWVHSLRNLESLIDNVFSPQLPLAVDGNNAPIARSDQVSVALQANAPLGIRAGLSAYARALDGLVLVAPATGHPFAVDGYTFGGARVWGGGISVEQRRARYRALMDYGFGAVTYEVGEAGYRPGFAISHSLGGSFGYYPSATLLLRTALRADMGRPTTLVEGPFEWEPCAIIDAGCEVAGSPQKTAGPLGGDRLPAYLRLDIGVRKHWHPRILGRDGTLAGFATLSNVLGRSNFLGYTVDPATGERTELEMRPFSPLSVGFEWAY